MIKEESLKIGKSKETSSLLEEKFQSKVANRNP
jgi:hypothetical protein